MSALASKNTALNSGEPHRTTAAHLATQLSQLLKCVHTHTHTRTQKVTARHKTDTTHTIVSLVVFTVCSTMAARFAFVLNVNFV